MNPMSVIFPLMFAGASMPMDYLLPPSSPVRLRSKSQRQIRRDRRRRFAGGDRFAFSR